MQKEKLQNKVFVYSKIDLIKRREIKNLFTR